MTLTYWEIGPTVADMLNIRYDLGLDEPFQDAFNPYSVNVDASDALVYGHGWGLTAFRWGLISQADRNILKSYCPNKSATVYVRLRDDDWNWVYCKATMIWPDRELPPNNGWIFDLVINFRIIENYGASPP